ncbi:MAG: hypothetical protein Q8T13_23855 [Acidobacteriota bacterium]|nr:hypothetical protein [Acidobacteriota bacterium]
MLKVYIAAPFQLKSEAVVLLALLQGAGYEVTSTWLRVTDMPDTDQAARLDLADIDRSDVLVAMNPHGWESKGTGGRHGEFLYAHAKGKELILLGVRSNVFHHLSNVRLAGCRAEVLVLLVRLWAERRAAVGA